MESRAHYALIGAFVIAIILGIVGFTAWLSNAQFDQEFDTYEVVFNGPVRGLSKGSEVRYNGLRVGEVIGLRWDTDDSNTIIADIQVFENTPIHRDSEAQLEPQGLTGMNYIQITTGASGEAFRGRGPFTITGRMSQIDTFLDEGGSLIDGAQSALGRVNTVMSQEAINDFQSILANVSTFTGNIKDTDVDTQLVERVLISFEKAAKDVSAAAIAVDEAAVEFDALVSGDVKLALSRVEKSLDEVDIMLAGITKFAEGGTDLTTDGRDAINRLSNSGLTDMEETADAMRRIMLSLAEIVEELERNPAQYISGAETETMELPQ